jgi:hypothetical protein
MNIKEAILDTEVKDTIPSILTDYLMKIIVEKTSIYGIYLVPEKLGSGEVQVIILETPNGNTKIRVFGFIPVRSKLEVERDKDKIALLAAS